MAIGAVPDSSRELSSFTAFKVAVNAETSIENVYGCIVTGCRRSQLTI